MVDKAGQFDENMPMSVVCNEAHSDCRPVILFVAHTGAWGGGAELVLLAILRAAHSGGYRTHLTCPEGDLLDHVAPFADAISILPLPWLRRTRNPLTLLKLLTAWCLAIIRVLRTIHRSRATIVHATSGVSALIACIPALIMRRTLIWHQRDLVPYRRINRLVLGTCGSFCTIVIACSQSVADSLKLIGVPQDHIRVRYGCVRDEVLTFPPRHDALRSLCLPSDAAIVTVIGRLVPRKGQDIFLQALARVVDAGYHVHGLILGSTPSQPESQEPLDAYRRKLEDMASQPSLRNKIAFHEYRDDVGTVYAVSDILVVPSWAEPFGLITPEAWAAGVPVVASASGGPLEIIEHERTGLLVPPGDVEAFASGISRLLSDQCLYRTLSTCGRESMQRGFSEESFARELVSIWKMTRGAATKEEVRD